MIRFTLILHYNMGRKCPEDPFNMGIFYLPKAPFKMGRPIFSDPQHTHPVITYWRWGGGGGGRGEGEGAL